MLHQSRKSMWYKYTRWFIFIFGNNVNFRFGNYKLDITTFSNRLNLLLVKLLFHHSMVTASFLRKWLGKCLKAFKLKCLLFLKRPECYNCLEEKLANNSFLVICLKIFSKFYCFQTIMWQAENRNRDTKNLCEEKKYNNIFNN